MKISQAIKNALTAITARFIFILDADRSNRLSKGRILFVFIALCSVLWVDTASAARFTCCVCRQFSGSTVTQALCMTSRERSPDDQAAQATATEACERYDSMGADFSCYSTQNTCDATTDCATAVRTQLNEPETQYTNCCVLSPIGGSGAKVCLESNPHSAGDSDRNRAADQRCRGLTATGAEYDNYTYRLYRNTRCRSTGLREQCGTTNPLSLGESVPTGAIVGDVAAAVDRPCSATENCPTGQTCQAGICVASSGGGCETNADCTSGLECRQVDPSSARKECMASAPAAEPEVPFEPIVPELGVTIPGLNFSAPEREGGVVTVNFIATYINAAYRYISAIGLVVAIVMVVYGGFIYLVGSAGMSSIQRGKKIITDAIAGMLLILSAYTILNLINPATVNLTALELPFVTRVSEAEVFATEGALSAESDYAATEGEPLPPPTSGDFRSRMLALCGSKDGYSLSPPERITRLKSIVNGWKTVGSDQGGAIYVRGGIAGCTYSTGDPSQATYLLKMLSKVIRPETMITLSGNCGSLIAQARSISDTERDALARANSACSREWGNEYKRIVTDRARAAGMFCGDCATTMRDLFNCFGNRGRDVVMNKRPPRDCGAHPSSPGAYPDAPGYIGRYWKPTQADVDSLVSRLQFGDVLSWQQIGGSGHVFMYTGGAGLGFEILEMGGGGDNDLSATGGDAASRALGFTFRLSGMRYSSNAQRFLSDTVRQFLRNRNSCLWAWRPLQM